MRLESLGIIMRRMRGLVWLLPWTIAGCSCGGPGGDPDAGPTGPGRVELGTGTGGWEPLVPEQEVPLYTGPQGGHHFIMHARIEGLLPGDPATPGQLANPITRFEVFLPDDAGVEHEIDMMFPPFHLGYEDAGDGWYELASGRIMQIQEEAVAGVVGARVHITVEVTDASGKVATDDRWLHAYAGPVVGFGDGGPVDNGGDAGAAVDAGADTAAGP